MTNIDAVTVLDRRFFVEEDLGDGFAMIQREDFGNEFSSPWAAADAAAELWAQNDNGLLGLPAYRVAAVDDRGGRNYAVAVDPIDCRPES